MSGTSLYDAAFVRSLFDEMSGTYGITNLISSFGFCKRWRDQCVAQVAIRPGMAVWDLMTGMGECWPAISRQLQGRGRLIGLDFSPEMCRRARGHMEQLFPLDVEVVEEDMLVNTIPSASADCVISSFGLKTFSDDQRRVLAREVARILRPGGTFSFLEISLPPSRLLKVPFMFYLKHVVPLLGRLLLGNPDNYRLLGVYTEHFGDCRTMGQYLASEGLRVEHRSYFFGCATGLVGSRP